MPEQQPPPPQYLELQVSRDGETSEREGGRVQFYQCILALCDQRWPGVLARVHLTPEPAVTPSSGGDSLDSGQKPSFSPTSAKTQMENLTSRLGSS